VHPLEFVLPALQAGGSEDNDRFHDGARIYGGTLKRKKNAQKHE